MEKISIYTGLIILLADQFFGPSGITWIDWIGVIFIVAGMFFLIKKEDDPRKKKKLLFYGLSIFVAMIILVSFIALRKTGP